MTLTLVGQGDGVAVHAWVSGVDVPGPRERGECPILGTFAGHVLPTKTSVIVEAESELDLLHRFPWLVPDYRSGLRSYLAIALLNRNQAIAVLPFGSKQLGAYSQMPVDRAERIGTKIAGALSSYRLYAEGLRVEEGLRDGEERLRESLSKKEVLLGASRCFSVLLNELNHRVKNNLQIISSQLELQSRGTHDPLVLIFSNRARGVPGPWP